VGKSFKELLVWQKAVQLSLEIYKLTQAFPSAEQFGLTNQLRRASVSVASNIAEGYGRSTTGEYVLFLGHARGSLFEVLTQLTIARELKFGTSVQHQSTEELAEEVSKMLVALMKHLKD
jgi:four helix bundle protein